MVKKLYSLYEGSKQSEREMDKVFVWASEEKKFVVRMMEELTKRSREDKRGKTYFIEVYDFKLQQKEKEVIRSKRELLTNVFIQ